MATITAGDIALSTKFEFGNKKVQTATNVTTNFGDRDENFPSGATFTYYANDSQNIYMVLAEIPHSIKNILTNTTRKIQRLDIKLNGIMLAVSDTPGNETDRYQAFTVIQEKDTAGSEPTNNTYYPPDYTCLLYTSPSPRDS